jgi:hypothetical protein
MMNSNSVVGYQDIMEIGRGVYHCSNWCDGGVTSVRGNFCPKCSWDEEFRIVDDPPQKEAIYWSDPERYYRIFLLEVFDKVGLHLV